MAIDVREALREQHLKISFQKRMPGFLHGCRNEESKGTLLKAIVHFGDILLGLAQSHDPAARLNAFGEYPNSFKQLVETVKTTMHVRPDDAEKVASGIQDFLITLFPPEALGMDGRKPSLLLGLHT